MTAVLCSAHICALLDCALLDERLSGALHKILYLRSGDEALVAACRRYHRLHMARGRRPSCARITELLLVFF